MAEEEDFICLNCKHTVIDVDRNGYFCRKFKKECPEKLSKCKEYQHFFIPGDTNKMYV